MICVNFKLSKFHAEGSSYILRAGRGKLRHNSSGFKATQRWFLSHCLCATLHHMEKSDKRILSGFLYNKVKKKGQNTWPFPVNSGLLATAEHLCQAHKCRWGAACLPLSKLVIWRLRFYLQPETAYERKRHFWVWQDVRCLSTRGGLRHDAAGSVRAPPQTTHHLLVLAHSQRLFSLRCLRDTPA